MPNARIPLLFGAGGFGLQGAQNVRTAGAEAVQKFIDVFVKQHGYISIDTARIYGGGTSEQVLAQVDLSNARVDTKVFPMTPGDHSPEKLRVTFKESKEALGSIPIRVFYLHAPDRTVPFEDTLEAVNDLYSQKLFEEFGLSNYTAWEVAEIVGICKRRGFVLPTVYQGVYNVLQRSNEPELFPCLHKFGIKFAAYSILAGGLLTGKYLTQEPQPGSHFDPKSFVGSIYTPRYMPLLPVVQDLKNAADKHNISLTQLASRWIVHHSLLTPEDHGAIIGASTPEQLENAINDCEQGPLPDDLVKACDEAWKKVQGIHSQPYFL